MSFRFKRLFVEYQSTLAYTLLTDSQQDITNSEIYCMDGRNVVVPVIEIQATVCFISSTANPFPVMKTGVPAMRTGVPCNENRFFPVWKTSQGKPCFGPVLALYRIVVK